MKKYKAVFCDIDGTLLTDEKELTPEVKQAVQKLFNSGIPFILTSGRMPDGIYPLQKQLGIISPLICFHGGLVLDENGETLLSKGLKQESAIEVEKTAADSGNKAAMNFYHGRDWFTTDLSHPMERWEADSIGLDPVEAHVSEVTKKDDVISKCMFAGYEEEILELEGILKKAFPDLRIVRSLPVLLEVINNTVRKSEGIEVICKKLGISPDEAVAIGDNFNDLDMLESVGLPVVMENAPEEVKAVRGAYIAPGNNESGVAKAIEEIFFSEEVQ